MVTEHNPIYPNFVTYKCIFCGEMINSKTKVCSKCGNNVLSAYIDPCDRCGLCGDKMKTKINCDFLVRDDVRY